MRRNRRVKIVATLGPATGRLVAEMITGATPFCDPAPYSASRFRH